MPHLLATRAAQSIYGLQEVLPSCLVTACPALRALRLIMCEYDRLTASPSHHHQQVAAAVLMQLQELHFCCVNSFRHCRHNPDYGATLAALPRLSSLSMTSNSCGCDNCTAIAAALSDSVPSVAGQLTQLRLVWHPWPEVSSPTFLVSDAMRHKLAWLQQLHLSRSPLDDAGLSLLLMHAPSLKHVKVSSCPLQTDHADAYGGCEMGALNLNTSHYTGAV